MALKPPSPARMSLPGPPTRLTGGDSRALSRTARSRCQEAELDTNGYAGLVYGSPPQSFQAIATTLPIQWVEMIEVEPAKPPTGKVYSTEPLVGEATNGHRYYIKGPEVAVVAAEIVAHLLAGGVGLRVPAWGLADLDGSIRFASERAPIHSGIAELLRMGVAAIPMFWPLCLAFDMWIANYDRDVGNVVARPVGKRRYDFLAIDFEKAKVLRGDSLIRLNMLPATNFVPIGDLESVPRSWETILLAARHIEAVAESAVADAFEQLTESGVVEMVGDTIGPNLRKRAKNLIDLCKEAYNG